MFQNKARQYSQWNEPSVQVQQLVSSFPGLSESQIGLVTGSFDLANLLFSFVVASVIQPEAVKFFYCAGMVWSSITVASFGLMSYAPDGTTYFVSCIVVRCVNGMGASMLYTTVLPMAIQMFPENSSIITSIIQTSVGMGFVIGPPMGSVLYGIGGYVFPFISVAVLEFIFSGLAIYYVPARGARVSQKIKQSDYFRYITRPGVIAVGLPPLVLFGIAGFRDSAYSLYFIDNLGMDEESVGYIFMSLSVAYVIGGPVYGYLVERGYGAFIAITVITTSPISLFLFFLPKLVSVLENIPYTVMILFFNGCTLAGLFNPSYLLLEKVAYRYGYTNRSQVKTMVATAFNLVTLRFYMIF